jgi:predicted secreted protein
MTTGYTWVYTMSPENIIREKSNEYIQTNTGGNIVGAGGTFVFTFESISKGETELVFSYLRVWENDIPAIDTKVYRAIVDEKNNLTLLQE